MKKRNAYPAFLMSGGVLINEIIIDQHYRRKHSDHMDDGLILALVNSLKKDWLKFDSQVGEFRYYVFDPLVYLGKSYRLIVVIERGKNYIGVINAFRR